MSDEKRLAQAIKSARSYFVCKDDLDLLAAAAERTQVAEAQQRTLAKLLQEEGMACERNREAYARRAAECDALRARVAELQSKLEKADASIQDLDQRGYEAVVALREAREEIDVLKAELTRLR